MGSSMLALHLKKVQSILDFIFELKSRPPLQKIFCLEP